MQVSKCPDLVVKVREVAPEDHDVVENPDVAFKSRVDATDVECVVFRCQFHAVAVAVADVAASF